MENFGVGEHGHVSGISWEVQYRSAEGYPCRATLSGEFGEEFLMKTRQLLHWLSKSQAKGFDAAPAPEASAKVTPGTSRTDDQKMCPIHNVPMRRYEKDGKAWYSHRTVDGGWCQGKQSSVRSETQMVTKGEYNE